MRIEDMVDRVVSRFIGTKHERDIKRLAPKIAAINELAGEYEHLSDADIREKSAQLKAQVTDRLGKAEPSDSDYKQRLGTSAAGSRPTRRRWT